MCGEYNIKARMEKDDVGSPPHVWGIHGTITFNSGIARITPTCVGNTPDSTG